MKQASELPAVGSYVEVEIDTSHVHAYLNPGAKHKVGMTALLRGIRIESPKWCADHVCLINSDTRAHNHVPPHRIVSMNREKVVQPKPSEDQVFTVKASKGDTTYTVQQNGVTKKWSCTCSGFQFRSKCRHIEGVIKSGP